MEKKFLVIGERCEDIFHYGEVRRLSPEAPIPIFVPIKKIINEGMAANVRRNLQSLLTKHGETQRIDSILSQNSAMKERFVDEKTNHYFLRVDSLDSSYERIKLENYTTNLIEDADVIIISDYNKGFLKDIDIIEICNKTKADCLVFLDTKKILPRTLYQYIDFIKMNEVEYNNNLNVVGEDFLKDFKKNIIVTLGSKGAMWNDILFPIESIVTMDVSGAGDTFLASLSYFYATTKDIEHSINMANKMSASVVSKRGVSTI